MIVVLVEYLIVSDAKRVHRAPSSPNSTVEVLENQGRKTRGQLSLQYWPRGTAHCTHHSSRLSSTGSKHRLIKVTLEYGSNRNHKTCHMDAFRSNMP